jgi:hypothetical protein
VHNFVHVDAVGIGFLLVVTIPAGIQKDFVFLVLLRVQHVVADSERKRIIGIFGIWKVEN